MKYSKEELEGIIYFLKIQLESDLKLENMATEQRTKTQEKLIQYEKIRNQETEGKREKDEKNKK